MFNKSDKRACSLVVGLRLPKPKTRVRIPASALNLKIKNAHTKPQSHQVTEYNSFVSFSKSTDFENLRAF